METKNQYNQTQSNSNANANVFKLRNAFMSFTPVLRASRNNPDNQYITFKVATYGSDGKVNTFDCIHFVGKNKTIAKVLLSLNKDDIVGITGEPSQIDYEDQNGEWKRGAFKIIVRDVAVRSASLAPKSSNAEKLNNELLAIHGKLNKLTAEGKDGRFKEVKELQEQERSIRVQLENLS